MFHRVSSRSWTQPHWSALASGVVFCLSSMSVSDISAQSTQAAAIAGETASVDSGDATHEFAVEKTFNNQPFRVQMKLSATKHGYRIYRLTYPSPVVTSFEPNNTIPADYYLPDGIKPGSAPRPAVVCLHILNGNYELVRMLCSSLASRGVPAMMFKLPYYGERALPGGTAELARNGKLFLEALPQGNLDARRTFDVLAARPEINPQRIGIAGISLGSIVSATTAGIDPRFWKAGLILSGGDLLGIIHHSRETSDLSEHLKSLPVNQRTEIEQAITTVDPLTHAAGLRDRATHGKVLMINASVDNVIPPAATKKLASALGMADRVVWLEGLGHYTAFSKLPEIMRQTVDFFAEDLPATANAPGIANAADDPMSVLARVISQAVSMLTIPPAEEGDCHRLDISASVTLPDGTIQRGDLHFIHGTHHRFRIQLKAPQIGEALLGQGEYPWMATDKSVFLGDKHDTAESRDPLMYADRTHAAHYRWATGFMATINMVPAILEQVVDVENKLLKDGTPILQISPKRSREQGQIRIAFQPDNKTPREAWLRIGDYRGKLTFRSWQPDSVASDALFQPPANLPVEHVASIDLYRIYAALFNFAMEFAE